MCRHNVDEAVASIQALPTVAVRGFRDMVNKEALAWLALERALIEIYGRMIQGTRNIVHVPVRIYTYLIQHGFDFPSEKCVGYMQLAVDKVTEFDSDIVDVLVNLYTVDRMPKHAHLFENRLVSFNHLFTSSELDM